MTDLKKLVQDTLEIATLPRVTINLMLNRTEGNDPFFHRIVKSFYESSNRRHKKFPLIRRFSWGVAVCVLPRTFDEYYMKIEASARRNYKKARRLGYTFKRIIYNNYLEDVRCIRESTKERQGRTFIGGKVVPCTDPESTSCFQDYPYFGVTKHGRLFAYCGCMISGEACLVQHILGHSDHQSDGVVPMLLIGVVEYILDHYPSVRFFIYDTYYGAGIPLRRFKRKFSFLPHRVAWALGMVMDREKSSGKMHDVELSIPDGLPYQLVFRRLVDEPLIEVGVKGVKFVFCQGPLDVVRNWSQLRTLFSFTSLLKSLAKLISPNRQFYFMAQSGKVLHHGWTSTSFYRHYKVCPNDVVIGPIWSAESARGRGIATAAIQRVINRLRARGHRVFFIDTSSTNAPRLRVINKLGFGKPIAVYLR